MSNWTKVDAFELNKLPFVKTGEELYYLLVRTSGDFTESIANQRVVNYKRGIEKYKKNSNVMYYKQQEIIKFGMELQNLLKEIFESVVPKPYVVLCPIPTSKTEEDPYYDDRLDQSCEIAASFNSDYSFQKLLHQKTTTTATHLGGTRNPNVLIENLEIDNNLPETEIIVLVDDVLTSGAHFRACVDLLRSHYSSRTQIIGAFLARQKTTPTTEG